MNAITHSVYGSPDVLAPEEIPTPAPAPDEVLVRIHAASLNRSDWEGLTGNPLYARMRGLLRPRDRILGSDIAGTVVAVGGKHTRFKVGDEVYGDIMDRCGGLAEYVAVRGQNLVPRPAFLTHAQAAAIPQAGVIAWIGICETGHAQPGERVLINGAGGGSGMLAIQLAKQRGAEVTAVDNAEKLEFMRALGADHVIDYAREDFTEGGQQYDLIVDLVAHRSPFACARALRPKGRYYAVGGPVRTLLQILFLGPFISGKRVRVLVAMPSPQRIAAIQELVEAGTLKLVIDRSYPLREAAEALRYVGEGHSKGKVVIEVAPANHVAHGA